MLPPEPEPPCFDPMSFPPGLIPRLVEKHLEADPPYSPLSPLEVEEAGLPDPPEMTPYLKTRLDQFHAELQEYRAGMTRAEYIDEKRRQRRKAGLPDDTDDVPTGARSSRRAGADLLPSETVPGTHTDGSYKGPSAGSAAAGLGFGAAAGVTGLDSVYDSYRRQRSGAYHDFIAKAVSGANAPPNPMRGAS